ncbi:MAG: acyltransferase [Solobacterium sp.]|nr:acyltransferase [Solobacterium sp.]
MSRPRRKNRIRGLDSLRALAVLGVLLYHAFPVVFSGGFFGVVAFFVISGYLSGYRTLTQMKERTFSLVDYYRKRFFRIWPAMIIVLLAGTAVLSRIDLYRLADSRQEFLSAVLGYNNYWQLKMNASYFNDLADSSPFTHLWYIAVLIQFDLVWPWIMMIHCRIRRSAGKFLPLLLFFCLTAFSFLVMPWELLAKGKDLSWVYYATGTRVFSLLAGAFAGMMRAESLGIRPLKSGNPYIPRILYAAFVVITVLLYLGASGSSRIVYLGGMQLYTIAVCLVIELIAMNRRTFRRFVDGRLSRWLSSLSYEIYLWQYPVLLFSRLLFPEQKTLVVVLTLAVILVLSVWLHAFTASLMPQRRGRAHA